MSTQKLIERLKGEPEIRGNDADKLIRIIEVQREALEEVGNIDRLNTFGSGGCICAKALIEANKIASEGDGE